MNIKWNEYTWYSKLAAIIFFIAVLPVWTFYIGTQYEKTVHTLIPIKNIPFNNVATSTPISSDSSNDKLIYSDGISIITLNLSTMASSSEKIDMSLFKLSKNNTYQGYSLEYNFVFDPKLPYAFVTVMPKVEDFVISSLYIYDLRKNTSTYIGEVGRWSIDGFSGDGGVALLSNGGTTPDYFKTIYDVINKKTLYSYRGSFGGSEWNNSGTLLALTKNTDGGFFDDYSCKVFCDIYPQSILIFDVKNKTINPIFEGSTTTKQSMKYEAYNWKDESTLFYGMFVDNGSTTTENYFKYNIASKLSTATLEKIPEYLGARASSPVSPSGTWTFLAEDNGKFLTGNTIVKSKFRSFKLPNGNATWLYY